MPFGLTIENQKEYARNLINLLKNVDPFVMIAGGAPRDWHFNKLANDLDIYMRLPNHNTVALVTDLARSTGIEKFQPIAKVKESTYAELPNLSAVYEGYYRGMKVNLMVMSKGVGIEIVKDFDVGICKIWLDATGTHYHDEFEFCLRTRVCVVHPNYTGKEAHVRKMAQRFPQFMFYKKLDIGEPDVSFDFDPAPAPQIPPIPIKRKKTLDDAWDDDNI